MWQLDDTDHLKSLLNEVQTLSLEKNIDNNLICEYYICVKHQPDDPVYRDSHKNN